MEPITSATLAAFLALFFQEAGKTLAVESVKLALEKRQDIKNSLANLFKPEIISLGLNENQTSEEVKALLNAKPEIEDTVQQKIKSNSKLLEELANVLSKHQGRAIHTTNYFENVNTINIDQRRS